MALICRKQVVEAAFLAHVRLSALGDGIVASRKLP
jgi:hypothetical protein